MLKKILKKESKKEIISVSILALSLFG